MAGDDGRRREAKGYGGIWQEVMGDGVFKLGVDELTLGADGRRWDMMGDYGILMGD